MAEETTCQFCYRVIEKINRGYALCRYHLLAYDSLQEGCEVWKERLGEVAWRNYLRRVFESPDTGAWVKELALAELQKMEQ